MFADIAKSLADHAQQLDRELAAIPHVAVIFFLLITALVLYVNSRVLRIAATANTELRAAVAAQIEYVVLATRQLEETRRLLEETNDANKRLRSILYNLTSKRRGEVTEDMRLGYVYFILDKQKQLIKIGYSNDPQSRFSNIQTSNGTELQLLLAIRGNKQDESDLHERFQVYRRRGEWFEYCGAIQHYIEEAEDRAVEVSEVSTQAEQWGA